MAEQSHCAKSPTECILMPLSWDAQRAKFFGQRALSTIVFRVASGLCVPLALCVCVATGRMIIDGFFVSLFCVRDD